MEQLFEEFGHMGSIDLTVRPRTNVRMALSAGTLSGKKVYLAKLRVLVNTGLFSIEFSVPDMESSGPNTRVPRRVAKPER